MSIVVTVYKIGNGPVLAQLARRTPLLPGSGAVTFIDVDSLLRRMYG
jgi:hypothetical protein